MQRRLFWGWIPGSRMTTTSLTDTTVVGHFGLAGSAAFGGLPLRDRGEMYGFVMAFRPLILPR